MLQMLRVYWSDKTINYCSLILVALLGMVLPTWYYQLNTWVTPLVLGVIAAALTDREERFTGRLTSVTLTLACFALAAFSIELLFQLPWLFAIGLFVSSFGFIMLGAMGARYATIAFGSLLIAIYTMLGAHQSPNVWFQPVLLLTGAAWYYLLAMIWQLLWPMQPVQQHLSSVFEHLADYLAAKSQVFHPLSHTQPQRWEEVQRNAATVDALNQCKAILLTRAKGGWVDSTADRFLNLYFLAQDIHERASSSHYSYQELTQHFARSDLLFRFKYLLEVQAKACRTIARCIRLGQSYQHTGDSIFALDELQLSLDYLRELDDPKTRHLLLPLGYLLTNLATIERLLSNVSNPDASKPEESRLEDRDAASLKERWLRLVNNFTTDSLLFRHALRISFTLTLGYGLLQALGLERGYWILLTILFVCQPNYAATRQKLTLRILGTLSGLLIGVPLLTLFPSQESQLVLMVLSGVLFFAFRIKNYAYATLFITLLVLFCFNQLGEGYAVVLPRLLDTLIGCVLSVAAVVFILPDWQSKRLHRVMADAIAANRHYLDQIIGQYRIGKKDNLSYRIARRKAHEQDAALSLAVSNMLAEPGRYHAAIDESFRFLTLNHVLLSYISALGAHRTRLEEESVHQLILDTHRVIHHQLNALHDRLLTAHCVAIPEEQREEPSETHLEQRLEQWREEQESSVKLVLQQLHLIYRMLPELTHLAQHFSLLIPPRKRR